MEGGIGGGGRGGLCDVLFLMGQRGWPVASLYFDSEFGGGRGVRGAGGWGGGRGW